MGTATSRLENRLHGAPAAILAWLRVTYERLLELTSRWGEKLEALKGRLSPRQLLALQLALGLPLVLAAVLMGKGLYFLYIDKSGLPDIEPLVRYQPLTVGVIEDARGEVLVERGREYGGAVAFEDLKPVMLNAILSAEDKRFFKHRGVDLIALPRVFWKNARSQDKEGSDGKGVDFSQGGSTITQQLVRIYFLRHLTSREKGDQLIHNTFLSRLIAKMIGPTATNKLARKAEEVRISLWLERQMRKRYESRRAAKEQILARYASLVYLGHGRHGFAAASEYYFGKSLTEYTDADAPKAALLAGLAKSPENYAPSPGDTADAVKRRNFVLEQMVKNDFLDEDAARRFQAEEPVLAKHTTVKTKAPAVVGAVFHELEGLSSAQDADAPTMLGHLQVRTTVDMRIQQIVNQALENGLAAYEARHPRYRGQVQGAVVMLRNKDAAVLAQAGGREVYAKRRAAISDYDRVTDAVRQPGSAMKPIVYLTAFRRGQLSLDSSVPDEPISVPTKGGQKRIANYDGQYKGIIPARQALAESRNAVAIWLASQVGMPEIVRTARELGMESELEPYISTALGASEVRLLEMANVFRSMASGVLATPHLVQQVTAAGGKPVPLPRTEPKVLSGLGYALGMIQEGMRGVIRLPGSTAQALNGTDFGIPVMGKTGTTNSFRDALFIGSTYGPEGITVAVWVGFDDNRSLGDKESGGRAALPIFKEIVASAYGKGLLGEVPRFPESVERGIDDYLASAAAIAEANQWALQSMEWEGQDAAAPPELGYTTATPTEPPMPVLGRITDEAAPTEIPTVPVPTLAAPPLAPPARIPAPVRILRQEPPRSEEPPPPPPPTPEPEPEREEEPAPTAVPTEAPDGG